MIPDHTLKAINAWLMNGTHPELLGSFLRALLTNDLRGAVLHADPENLDKLADIVRWVYAEVPGVAYGTTERLIEWHKRGGLRGVAA